MHTAEEILRTIYGDDFKGCTVRLETIADLIDEAAKGQRAQCTELIELYEKVVEGIDLLSTPPEGSKLTDPNELRNLLSERLDAIHAITTRTMETTARAKSQGRVKK